MVITKILFYYVLIRFFDFLDLLSASITKKLIEMNKKMKILNFILFIKYIKLLLLKKININIKEINRRFKIRRAFKEFRKLIIKIQI